MPQKVLMTADTVGGIWTYALELCEALGARGVEVTLAAMGSPLTCEQRSDAHRLRNLKVIESDFKLEWMDDPWNDLRRAGDWLLGIEQRVRPDIVHLNGYVHGALLWNTPSLVVGHSCVVSWWEAVFGTEPPAKWDLYRFAVARGLRAADMVAAPSAAMLAALSRHYGPIPDGKVVHNGRSPRLFAPAEKAPFILSAGRLWDKAKNMAVLDRVAPEIDWPVYVAGEELHPNGSKTRFASVRPLGRLSTAALAGWYARAAIYALPARYEPFGLSVLEAALAGCALVLGDIPSQREIWGDAALFVDPGSDRGVLEALRQLARDQNLRHALAGRARERARAFTPESMADGYLAAYRAALRPRTAAAV